MTPRKGAAILCAAVALAVVLSVIGYGRQDISPISQGGTLVYHGTVIDRSTENLVLKSFSPGSETGETDPKDDVADYYLIKVSDETEMRDSERNLIKFGEIEVGDTIVATKTFTKNCSRDNNALEPDDITVQEPSKGPNLRYLD